MGKYYAVNYEKDENSLAHYGVPKMQWGKRRYQNPDGSLTPEGREHYGVGKARDSKGGNSGDSKGENARPTNNAGFRRSGGPARGMPGPLEVSATTYAVNRTRYELRKRNARKEVDRAGLNKDKERVTKDDIEWMSRHYNKKERSKIIQRMKDNPKMSFSKAEEPVHKEQTKRYLRNTAAFMAASVAIPALLAMTYNNRQNISDNLHKADDAVKRNKAYQSFMKSVKNRKIKNSVVLRSDEYEIDKRHNLPAGRG